MGFFRQMEESPGSSHTDLPLTERGMKKPGSFSTARLFQGNVF